MVHRYHLTYDEIIDILDLKYIPTTTLGYTLTPGTYEVSDFKMMLKSLLPEEVKVNLTLDDVRLKSKLTVNQTIKFTRMSFFYIILGLTQSHSDELGDIEIFIQLIPGSYKSHKPINITEIDKVHL